MRTSIRASRFDKVYENMVEASFKPLAKGTVLAKPVGDGDALWLGMTRLKGLGGVGFKRLAAHFADPVQAFFASADELERVEGLHREVIESLIRFGDWGQVEDQLRRTRAAGIGIVRFTDAAYPEGLRAIADPPPCLFIRGGLTAVDRQAVAIVGSRSASDYGRRMACDLAGGLAALGLTVVSGMARGIDATAHESALAAGGRTIAVLGCGVERVYPPEHAGLYRRIIDQGAVISELPLGTRPMAFHFPARNRLISGLSLGVVVVEATERSGSLITARLALEQGREVFAVPGPAGASRSRGTHRLIRQGAKLVETVDDIIEEIAPQLLRRSDVAAPAERNLPPDAAEETRKIVALLQEQPLHVDQVIERSGLPPAQVLEMLLDLELQGFLRQSPGKFYSVER